MPDDFESSKRITLRWNDNNVPYTFTFPVCSTATANDGAVPFGLTISSHTIRAQLATDPDWDVTGRIVNSSTLNSATVTAKLKWPGIEGIYHLVFKLTFSDGSVKDYVFENVRALAAESLSSSSSSSSSS